MKRYILIALTLFIASLAFADVEIGNGTASQRFPLGHLWGYERSAALYLESEVVATGTITQLGWNVQSVGSQNVPTKIYITSTTQTQLSSITWDSMISGLTPVYNETRMVSQTGWNTFDITDFNYTGGNLLVMVETNYGGSGTSGYPNIYYTSATNMHQYWTADTNPPTGSGTLTANRPNIKLYGITPTVPPFATTPINPPDGATLISTNTSVTWNTANFASGYKIHFGTTNNPPFVADLGNNTSYTPTGLTGESTYYWKVIPYNEYGEAANCPVWSFTTAGAGIITIGTGTATSRFPLGSYYGFERSISLYTSAEIGGGNLRINSLGWYATQAGVDNVPTKIYLKMYPNNTLISDTWANLISDADLSFDATINGVQANAWNMIDLENSFDLDDGNNLAVLVERNYTGSGGSTGSVAPAIYASTVSNMHHTLLADSSPPTSTTSAQTTRPNIMLATGPIDNTLPPNPAVAVFPANNATMVSQNPLLQWRSGGGAPTGYKLYFGATSNPPFIADLGATTTYQAGPLAAETTYYWKIVPYNANGEATNCPVWSFSTLPDGLVFIGDGTATGTYLPVNTLWGYSYSQTIYLQSEINMPEQRIEKLAYYWDATGAGTNNDQWTVYMGHTDANQFASTSDWIPFTNLTQVYSGQVNFPTTEGWLELVFNNPFVYNNSQNLVIAVLENSPSYTYGGSFLNTASTNRSIRAYSDSIVPDPANPPGGASQTLQAHYPNIRMLFGDLPDHPILTVNPSSLNFGQVVHAAPSTPQNLMLINTGAGILNLSASDISIIGTHAAEFSFNPVNLPAALTPGQSVMLPVQVTATTVGQLSATLRIVYNNENHDVALSAQGMPAGLVFIGNGNANQMLPVYPYYGYTYSQSIFLQSEIATPNQRIEKIAYYWNGAGAAANTGDWVIYIGHTDASTFGSTVDWIPLTQLTQVFDGTVSLPATAGWVEIVLSNPFVYNNTQNLVIAVDENRPGYDSSGMYFYSTTTTGNRSLRYYSDSENPNPASPPVGTLVAAYPNLRIEFGDLPDHPILTVSPSSLNFGMATHDVQSAPLNVMLGNTGAGIVNITAADISIIGTNADEFGFLTTNLPAALSPGQNVFLPVYVHAQSQGAISATLRIVYDGENHDVALSATGLPEGTVFIGDGIATGTYLPVNTLWGYSYTQMIYLSSEVNMPGRRLEKIAYYWDATGAGTNNDQWVIYMGHTNATSFASTSDWISLDNLVEVYNGTVSFPNTAGWMEIELDLPFMYDSTQNLVIAVDENSPSYTYGGSFLATPATNRSLRSYSDSINIDPASPPSGASSVLQSHYPNIMMLFGEIPTEPVFHISPADAYDFGDVNLGGSKSKVFSISNYGAGSLGITSISISGSTTFALSQLPTLPVELEFTEATTFTVTYTPNSLSSHEATLTITDNLGRRYILGASREAHTLDLSGSGVNDINIGDGSQTARMPMDFYYRCSLYETIFTANEMGNFIGMITGLKLYNQFSSNLSNMPTKIWLGSTTQTNLSAGWIPATQLELVFDGTMDFPSGSNIINFVFPEPYMHLDGGNLVMMIKRPLDAQYYSSADNFKTQSMGSNRARNLYSDSIDYNPDSPETGSLTGIYPQITFTVIPGGVGTITGTVLGEGNAPLAGVNVVVDGRPYGAITDANGEFTIIHVLPGDYSVTFSKHTYISQVINIVLEEDETEVIDITMQLMPRVTVSGTILASDTGAGIAGANIRFTGYETFMGSSIANGTFSIPNVFANQTYNYVISAVGYVSTTGELNLGAANHNMGNITLAEVAYAPNSVVAEQNDTYTAVNLNWNAPDPNAVEITESFEGTEFPPAGWSQVITNTGAANTLGVYPTWCSFGAINTGTGLVEPTEGAKQAGLWWVTEHQDEWLKTPAFNCPPDAYMTFDTYATYGSPNGDHYYVKISNNGGNTWTALWDASVLPEGENNYQNPITVDLSNYAGSEVILAFHADDPPSNDGLWNQWFIDNIYIGNMVQTISFDAHDLIPGRISINSGLGANSSPNTELNRAPQLRYADSGLSSSAKPHKAYTRALVGYKVWRLTAGQENNEAVWISLTDELISTLNYADENWANLPNNTYKWAVKAVYTADVISAAAISNALVKEQLNGTVVGFVRRSNNQGIPGAVVTASNGTTATTNSSGAYSMLLPIGNYSFTATANGYHPFTQNDIIVVPNQNTTLNFVLIPLANEDEVVPITATALKGNYPNPFNPETTISYDLKDAAMVRLDVYNLKGQLVRSLVNEMQPTGRYRIVFDGKDGKKLPLSSGIYLYRFSAGEYRKTQKMMLMQ